MEQAKLNLDRRAFLGGASLLGISAVCGLAGCSPKTTDGEEAGEAAETLVADEETSCDIVIVGGGISGLSAAVQASELGANVILVEAGEETGGNGRGVEGCFGNGSKMQAAQGIEAYDTAEIVRHEMESSQWRAYGPAYVSLMSNAGTNVDWLVDNGVKFSNVASFTGTMETFHFFEGGVAGTGYVPYMTEAATKNGTTIMLNSKAQQLVFDDAGKVAGVVVVDNANGKNVQINAKAVILATGGFPHSKELLGEMRVREDDVALTYSVPACDGTGHKMAVSAGAESYVSDSVLLAELLVPGAQNPFEGGVLSRALTNCCPTAIWVNDSGQRIVAEDFLMENMALMSLPSRNYRDSFIVLDQASFDSAANTVLGSSAATMASLSIDEETQMAIDGGGLFKANTIEELAEAAGISPKALQETVERYNQFAANGKDEDYNKSAELLVPLSTPPYYCANTKLSLLTVIGSIYTDENCNALDTERNPIDSLYVVGVEGARLWAGTYTIDVGGGCCANNVNSGRIAARHAVENCL